MHHAVDAELRDEAKQFSLVFTCRHCAHFAAGLEDGGCSLEFPVEPHLDVDLETAEQVTFCKAFELW
jgi:hypothetical protein